MRAYFARQFQNTWPDVSIGTMPKNGGSNDPFIFFTCEALAEISVDWKQIFRQPPPMCSLTWGS
jgi:hypothetical protein